MSDQKSDSGPKFEPLSTYRNFDLFKDRLTSPQSEKSPSLLALQSLIYSRPALAKEIFDRAVMEPFTRLLSTEFPIVQRLSDEAQRRIEELQARFLQTPTPVLRELEAIFVIERVEPWARNTVEIMSRGDLTLEQVRADDKHRELANQVEGNGCALAHSDLVIYVRERDYRIMLELVRAIDGRSVEQQAEQILQDLPTLKGYWDDFGDGTTGALIGPDGARKIVSWIFGYIEF